MKVMGSRVGHIFRLCVASLGDLFFPRMCLVCGSKLDIGVRHICPRCADDIPFTYFWGWEGNPAEQRLAALAHIDEACSLFFYRRDSSFSRLIHQFKYGGDIRLGRRLARMLGEYMADVSRQRALPEGRVAPSVPKESQLCVLPEGAVAEGAFAPSVPKESQLCALPEGAQTKSAPGRFRGIDAVVPVPLHPLKKFRRGFNQSDVIARELAAALGAAFEPKLIRRRRYTRTQTRTDDRRRNMAGAFALNERVLRSLHAAGVQRILLVDDVLTTGSTIAAAAAVLPSSFRLSAATLACVE